MPRNLLIDGGGENGRAPTTYGPLAYAECTMRFALLTLIFGCVYVCGDLEIYPGVEQEETYNDRDQSNNFFEQFYLDPRWRASIPWNDRDDQDYYKSSRYIKAKLSEQVRQIEDFVSRRRQQLKEEAEKSAYRRLSLPEPAGDGDDEFVGRNSFQHYQLKYPNQQILDDVRPYPHEENDFSFKDGDEEEREEDRVLSDEREKQEASGKGALLDPKYEEEAEFAYVPPDPRFYEDTSGKFVFTEPKAPDEPTRKLLPLVKVISTTDGSGQIVVSHRNEGKFPFGQIGEQFQVQKHDNTVEVVAVRPHMHEMESAGVYVIAIVAGISAAATVGLIAFAIGWYNLQKHVKNAADVEYPAYGVTGPNKEVSPSGDRRLAQSAQMYHYQHQKQQIIAMESRAATNERHGSISEADSDEENEEGDYTVYECPGLAPTGEMEVKNPLFQDDPTPAQTPQVKQNVDSSSVQKK